MQTPLDTIRKDLTAMLAMLDLATEHLQALTQRVTDLEQAGIVDASPTYKDGKYLYLVSPMIDGQRRREYVGSDPDKIAVALGRIQNFKDHAEAIAALHAYESHLASAREHLRMAKIALNPSHLAGTTLVDVWPE